MANDTNSSRQVSASDIKGDLAQRLRCPGCTRTFAQVEGRNKVELDKKETAGGDRHAISFICNECRDNETAPVFAFRLVGGLVQEVRVEDLPDLSPSRGTTKASRGRSATNTRKRRSSKTTPSESESDDALTAAGSIAPGIDEDEEP